MFSGGAEAPTVAPTVAPRRKISCRISMQGSDVPGSPAQHSHDVFATSDSFDCFSRLPIEGLLLLGLRMKGTSLEPFYFSRVGEIVGLPNSKGDHVHIMCICVVPM